MTKRKLMTENLKEEIAKELGVYEQVKKKQKMYWIKIYKLKVKI